MSLFKFWILGSRRQISFQASLKFSPYCPHTAANFASPEMKFVLLRVRSKTCTSSKIVKLLRTSANRLLVCKKYVALVKKAYLCTDFIFLLLTCNPRYGRAILHLVFPARFLPCSPCASFNIRRSICFGRNSFAFLTDGLIFCCGKA